MLSLFPQLFTYQELAPFLLRLAAGFIAISFAYPKIKNMKEYREFSLGLVEIAGGLMLIAGFLTQLAAGLIIAIILFEIFRPSDYKNYKFMALLMAVLISLMFLGPGFFSFDLPL